MAATPKVRIVLFKQTHPESQGRYDRKFPAQPVETAAGRLCRRPRQDRPAGGIGLPPYLKCAKSIEKLLPRLYLMVISTGDFSEALAVLLRLEAVPKQGSILDADRGAKFNAD